MPAENLSDSAGAEARPAGFGALSRFVVADGPTAEVKCAFAERSHLSDAAPGLVRPGVIGPADCPEEIWHITYWREEERFRVGHRSREYRESHRGIPQGPKPVPRGARVCYFEHVSS